MPIKQIIGQRDAGQTIPQSLVETLTKDSTSFAIMVAQDGELKSSKVDKAYTTKEFMDWQTSDDAKDLNFGFVFTKGGKLSVESLQPFVINKHDGTAVCTVMLGGTLMTPMPPQSEHTQSYHAFQRIKVKLERLYNSASSLPEFKKLLEGEEFMDDMSMTLGTEGAMSILHYDGAYNHYGTAVKGGNFSWGMISDALGYKEKAAAEKVEEKPKGGLLSGLSKIGSAIAGPKAEEAPKPVDPPKAEPDTVVVPLKETTAPVPAGTVEFEMYQPRKGLKKQKELHRVLSDKLGCVPMGAWETYENGGLFPVPVRGAIKFGRTDQYEVFRNACASASTNYVPAAVLTQVPPTPPKEEQPPKVETSDVSSVVSAAGKKHFNEVFRKRPTVMQAVAESRDEIINPKNLSLRDNKASSTFAEQSGLKSGVYDTLCFSEQDIHAFLKDEDKTLQFLLVRDLMLEVIALKAAVDKSAKTGTPVTEKKQGGLLSGLAKTA